MPVEIESPRNVMMAALAERGYSQTQQLRLLAGLQEMVRQGAEAPTVPQYCQQWQRDMVLLYTRWQEVAPNVRSVDALDATMARSMMRDGRGNPLLLYGPGGVPEVAERPAPAAEQTAAGPSYEPSRETWRQMIPRPGAETTLPAPGEQQQLRPEQQTVAQTYRYTVELQGTAFTFDTTNYMGETTTVAAIRALYEKEPTAITRITTSEGEQPRGVFGIRLRAEDEDVMRQGKAIEIRREPTAPQVFVYRAEFVRDDGTSYQLSFTTNRGFDLRTIHDLNRALEFFGDSFTSLSCTTLAPDGSEVMDFNTPREIIANLARTSLQRRGALTTSEITLTARPPVEARPSQRSAELASAAYAETPEEVSSPARRMTYVFETAAYRYVIETTAPLPSLTMEGLLAALDRTSPDFRGDIRVTEIWARSDSERRLSEWENPSASGFSPERRLDYFGDDATNIFASYLRTVAGDIADGSNVRWRLAKGTA